MDRNPDDLGSSSWDARILLEVADTLLDSPDITLALAQAETDASVLRDVVVKNSEDLILSGTTGPIEFVERIEWELFLSRRSLRYVVPALAFLLTVSIAGVITDSLAGVIIGCIVLFIIFAIIVTGGVILYVSRIFTPADVTKDVLRNEVVGPFLREQINLILAKQEHADVMRITAAPGLTDLSDREQLVITDTIKDTLKLCTSMSSGSVGISGPRGVGKTTLLRYLCDPLLGASVSERGGLGSSDLRIFISAPVEFNTKDFILHLFGKLCHAVIDGERNLGENASYMWKGRFRGRFASLALGCILVICGLGFIGYALFRPRHIPELSKPAIFLGAGVFSLAAGIGILVLWARSRLWAHGSSAETVPLIDEARAWLTRISYLQTLTSGYAGSVKIPAGLGLQVTSGRQLSELELTLPDLIDRYKSFAGRVIDFRRLVGNSLRVSRESQEQSIYIMERRAALLQRISKSLRYVTLVDSLADQAELMRRQAMEQRQRLADILGLRYVFDSGPKIMIGIDEVDKIGVDSAQRFLNDIKAIFGVPNCLYMVSVSDEALAMFEQRVLIGRTAFDSSFDEVVRARELNFESCRYLLRRRIAGVPDSLIAFCEVMSGGLPRDLIRMARSAVEAAASGKERVKDLTLSVVNNELENLRRAFIGELTSISNKQSESRFLESVLQNDWIDSSAQSILTRLEGTADSSFPAPVSAALYFYGTIAEIFSSEILNSHCFLSGYRLENTDWIDRLAQARNMISVDSDIAWELISHLRDTCRMRVITRTGSQRLRERDENGKASRPLSWQRAR